LVAWEAESIDVAERVCGLTECAKVVRQTSRQVRWYCCAEHRKIARARRREEWSRGGAKPMTSRPVRSTVPDRELDHHEPTNLVSSGLSGDPGWGAVGSDLSADLDPPTVPIRLPYVVIAWRSWESEPATCYRRLVPEPEARWFRRPCRPYAVRDARRYTRWTMPEWMRILVASRDL